MHHTHSLSRARTHTQRQTDRLSLSLALSLSLSLTHTHTRAPAPLRPGSAAKARGVQHHNKHHGARTPRNRNTEWGCRRERGDGEYYQGRAGSAERSERYQNIHHLLSTSQALTCRSSISLICTASSQRRRVLSPATSRAKQRQWLKRACRANMAATRCTSPLSK